MSVEARERALQMAIDAKARGAVASDYDLVVLAEEIHDFLIGKSPSWPGAEPTAITSDGVAFRKS